MLTQMGLSKLLATPASSVNEHILSLKINQIKDLIFNPNVISKVISYFLNGLSPSLRLYLEIAPNLPFQKCTCI